MWICPNCQNQCETPFCPLCGYEKPNQISQTDLVVIKEIKKLQKRSNFLTVSVIVLLILVIVSTIFCCSKVRDVHDHFFEAYHFHTDRINAVEDMIESYHPEETVETVPDWETEETTEAPSIPDRAVEEVNEPDRETEATPE